MEQKAVSINLLKKQGAFLDKFVDWALTVGRLLVILTELIALSAFLYRFSLDRKLIDLHGKIKQQEAVVKTFKTSEDKYRSLQDRLALASSFSNVGTSKIKIFQDILNFAPNGVRIGNLVMYENRININAAAQNTSSLKTFINSLKTYPKLKKLSLNSIQIKITSGLAVTLTADF